MSKTVGSGPPPPPAFDPDAQAFFTASGLTGATELNAVNQLVLDMKAYGIWSKMKAIYPFVGGTAALHKWNLKDPQDTNAAFRLVFSGGWTHSSTGALPNGTNGYGNTFLVPNTVLSLNSVHISGYVRNNIIQNAPIISSEDAGTYNNGLYIWPKQSGFNTFSVRVNDNTSDSAAQVSTLGMHLAIRTGSSVKKYFKNNVNLLNVSSASTSLNTSSIYIAKSRNNANYSSHEQAFSSIGDGLTDTEAADFYTAVQAFNTSLSRQV
jgi:hypothetical protein